MDINLKHLECFIALAETLNFTQAAASVFITQPALSRYVSAMEDELGILLFERDKRSVRLTKAGEVFLEEARVLAGNYETAMHRMQQLKKDQRGTLKVGYVWDISKPNLPPIINSFETRYPDIEIILQGSDYVELLTAFEGGKLDLIVASPEGTESLKDIDWVEIERSDNCAVMHESHPMAGRSSIHPIELANEPFLVLMHHPTFTNEINVVGKICRQHGFQPHVVGRFKYGPELLLNIACNRGVTILSASSREGAPAQIRHVRLEDCEPYIQTIVWKKENHNPCLPNFIEECRRHPDLAF